MLATIRGTPHKGSPVRIERIKGFYKGPGWLRDSGFPFPSWEGLGVGSPLLGGARGGFSPTYMATPGPLGLVRNRVSIGINPFFCPNEPECSINISVLFAICQGIFKKNLDNNLG